ncbi:MAG: hypothetical protein D6698_02905 [Gammaproteobacteria bacterium]|nr:MAG: hypothetical protein D6698_02905 [Gammaproteobacteria bacterium]
MHSIHMIARLSFIEMLRNKVLYGILAFVIIMLLVATALASVTMGRTELMIQDLGLGMISIIANLTAILFVIQSLQQDRTNRNLYILLMRIDNRALYLLGKFLGIATILSALILAMYFLLALMILPFGQIHWVSSFQACLATVLEVWIVIALALVFAQTSSLFLSVLLTVAVDIAGRFTSVIHDLGQQSASPILKTLSQVMYYLLPNLEAVNLRNDAGYIAFYAWDRFAHLWLYGLVETALLISIACWIFSRRNLS